MTCKTKEEKLRWAYTVVNRQNKGNKERGITFVQLEKSIRLLDEIAHGGYVNGPNQDEYDDIMYRRYDLDSVKDAGDRARKIWDKLTDEAEIGGRLLLQEEYMRIQDKDLTIRI